MGIKILLAKTPYEIDQAARLRYTVFAEEEGYYPKQDDKIIIDRYDILPTTISFIAMSGDEVIGAIRFTQNSEIGMPSDKYFDYRPHLPHYDHRIISGSMFCVKKAFRGNVHIYRGLLWMGFYWGLRRNAIHVLAPINPLIERNLARMGFKAAGDEIISKSGLRTLPMLLKLADASDSFLTFVKNQQLIKITDTFTREVYEPDERIISYGEVGASCYFIVNGKVRISIPIQGQEKHIRDCGAGEMFGEIALLANTVRTANITAITAVELMVLDQNSFQESVLKHPERSLELMQLLGKRLVDTQRRLLDFDLVDNKGSVGS